MATYAWTRTRLQFAQMVLRKLGVIGDAEVPAAGDAALVYEATDARLKEMHWLGVLWWNVAGEEIDLTLTGGVSTVAIVEGDYLFPVSLSLVVGTDTQPIEIIGHRAWRAIPNKTDTGEPEKAFFDGLTVNLYPVPGTAYTAKLTYQAAADDTDGVLPPDVPVSMLRALSVIVAGDLVDEYGLPDNRAQRLLIQVPQAIRTIRALNQERVETTPVAPSWF